VPWSAAGPPVRAERPAGMNFRRRSPRPGRALTSPKPPAEAEAARQRGPGIRWHARRRVGRHRRRQGRKHVAVLTSEPARSVQRMRDVGRVPRGPRWMRRWGCWPRSGTRPLGVEAIRCYGRPGRAASSAPQDRLTCASTAGHRGARRRSALGAGQRFCTASITGASWALKGKPGLPPADLLLRRRRAAVPLVTKGLGI